MKEVFGGTPMNESAQSCRKCGGTFVADESGGTVCPACMLAVADNPDSLNETVEILPGKIIGDYEVASRLGIGGMGVVYEAVQKSLRRTVALKMVRAPSSASHRDMARFRQEAEAAARLNHPNIVEVYEIGEFEGAPYFTMKYVEGAHSLSSELAKGPCDPERAARLVSEIARAIGYAHQRGVIHRDLKPANILLDHGDRPCIVDFGLAKLYDHSPSAQEAYRNLSDDGKLIGTPHYMSPEQIAGEDLTIATDIYSLGVVLYELLSGSPPFRSRSLNDVIRKVAEDSPKPISGNSSKVPRDLEVICLKCLRKTPSNRYHTAGELADDLDRWSNGEPIQARPSSSVGRLAKWARRHPGVAALSPMVAILALVAIVLLSFLLADSRKRLEEEVSEPFMEAVSLRTVRIAGRRWDALALIKKAADSLDNLSLSKRSDYRKKLQNEALYWLSQIDLRLSGEDNDSWVGDPDQRGIVRFTEDFSLYAHLDEAGDIVIRDRPENSVLKELDSPANSTCQLLRFHANQRFLAATFTREDGQHFGTVWDLQGENESPLLEFPVNGPNAIDFAPEGNLLYVAEGSSLKMLSLVPGTAPEEMIPLEFEAGILRVDRNQSHLAVSPLRGPGVVLIRLDSGVIVDQQDVPAVRDLDWNPFGRWLAIGTTDGTLRVWDTEQPMDSSERIVTLPSEVQNVALDHVAWHPRGVLVAGVSSATDQVHLWHVVSRELEVTWNGNLGPPQFSPEGIYGSRLGPVIEGKQVSLIEVAEGRVVTHARGHPWKGGLPAMIHGSWWRDLGPGKPGRIFSTAGDDGVRLWNRRGFEMNFLDEPLARAAIFTRKSIIVTGQNGVSVRPVSGSSGIGPPPPTITIGPQVRIDDGIRCWGADYHAQEEEKGLLAVAAGTEVRLYQVDEKNGSRKITFLDSLKAPSPSETVANKGNIEFVAINDTAEWIATGTSGGSGVQLWKRAKSGSWGLFDAEFREKGSAVVSFYRNPDPESSGNEWLITAAGDFYRFYRVGSWDAPASEAEAKLGSTHGAICFSPRTPVFAVSESQYIRIYTLPEFDILARPNFDTQRPTSFSSYGFLLLTADKDNYLHLWNLRYLRSQLAILGLDFENLQPFPSETVMPEPDPVEEIIVED